MAFEIPKQPYSGTIGKITMGTGKNAVTLGGEEVYPFHLFEGKMPNSPKIAMEIWDYDPKNEWPAPAVEALKDVLSSPENWAKKCVEEYGADIIVLQLKSIDPNGMDRSAEEAALIAKKLCETVDVPIVFWGTANNQKDEEVLKKISEICEGKNVSLSPVEEGNHKGVGASALGYGHIVVASSPIDVNLAKQLNILLGNLGVQKEKTMIDPTTGGLGYGMEYGYSVMERIRMAALTQEDVKLQVPMINNVGNEVWKCKEAGLSIEDAPTLGDPEKRPVLMEAVASVCMLLAGSDVVVVRHPESARLIRSFIGLMTEGGSATGVEGINKKIKYQDADLIAVSPEPDLSLDEEKPAAKDKPAVTEKKKTEQKKEEKKAVSENKGKPEEKEMKKEVEKKEAEKKAEAEAKKKSEEETKAGKEAEDKTKAEAEAKARAESEKKAEDKEKEEAEKKAKARKEAEVKSKETEDLKELRYKRAIEREKHETENKRLKGIESGKTASGNQPDLIEKLTANLDRIHRR